MSGHSRWAQIHRQKGAADMKKSSVFTKIAKTISIAAREGADPESNFKLRLAVDQARAANMPKENVERAIKRGSGELKDEMQLEEVVYEGFGPLKSSFIVECVTDNRNRTAPEIKHLFSKHGGSLASPNSVMWQFEKKGIIGIHTMNDSLELRLIDLGVSDIVSDLKHFTLSCEVSNFEKIKKFLEKENILIEFAEISYIPKEIKKISDPKSKEKIFELIKVLEENEDVKNYYTNVQE